MGTVCNAFRASHAGSVTLASMVLVIPAFEVMRVWEMDVTGMAASLAAGEEHGFYLATTVGSGGSPTEILWQPDDEEATVPTGFQVFHGYTTEPVLPSTPRIRLPYQPCGGVGPWEARGKPLTIHNKSASAIHAALRSISGTSNIALRIRAELGA